MIQVGYKDTDFGFILVHPEEDGDYYIECFGFTGMGRYDLFASCSCTADDDVDTMVDGIVEENESDVESYRYQVRALEAARTGKKLEK